MKEAFIRNFSAPYSLLQRHLVGEEGRIQGRGDTMQEDEHQQSVPPRLITELTTSSFLPCVMDIQKVRTHCSAAHLMINRSRSNFYYHILQQTTSGRWVFDNSHRYYTQCFCSLIGCTSDLLHSVVWILLCHQPHHHPAGQIITGKLHHHCGQVC